MLRLGSLVMVFLVTVPMVRDCCLPVTQRLPCHETQHTDDVTCFSNQQAIAETKTALGVSSSIDYQCPIADFALSAIGHADSTRFRHSYARANPESRHLPSHRCSAHLISHSIPSCE